MALLKLITPCSIEAHDGFDVHGQVKVRPAKDELCRILSVGKNEKPTMIRNDMSASHGAAMEYVSAGKFMLDPSTVATVNSLIVFGNMRLKVVKVQRVYTMAGKVDHVLAETTYWGE